MDFYQIAYDTHSETGWPWARRVHPRLHTRGTLCTHCGKGYLYPGRYPEFPMYGAVEGGAGYPDALGCSEPLLVVSDRVVTDWERAGITGYEPFSFSVVRATGEHIEGLMPPLYYHIHVTGRCQMDLKAMGVQVTFYCPLCGYRTEELVDYDPSDEESDPFQSFPYVIQEETWDGSDLFISEMFERVVFCSRKVFDLAGQLAHTNFRFRRPEEHHLNEPDIDYLAATHARFGAKLLDSPGQ